MKQSSVFKKAALALVSAGLLASASAHADNLVLDQDVNTQLGFTVSVNGSTRSVETGIFNVDNTTATSSFLAFCYEMLQGVNVGAVTTGLDFTASSTVPAAVQTLFNQSFSQVNTASAADVAGFQIALWEVVQDDGDIYGGNINNWNPLHVGNNTEAEALNVAWVYLQSLADGEPATGNYTLTKWSNDLSQDIIQASVGGGSVPEPSTLALGALGLAGLSAVRRRKS